MTDGKRASFTGPRPRRETRPAKRRRETRERRLAAGRANGDSQLADAIEATLVTTAAQREAALVQRQIPERDGPDHFRWSIEGGAEVEELLDTDEEKDVYDRRLAEYSRLVDRLKAEILAGKYD